MKIMDYTDEIENAIIDYCLKHDVFLQDVPLNVFELSRHVNDFVNIKNEEVRQTAKKMLDEIDECIDRASECVVYLKDKYIWR